MRTNRTKTIVSLLVMFLLMGVGVTTLGEEKKLDINSATLEQLVAVPGLSEEIAEKIIETREEFGEFVDLEELLDIEGISNSLFRKLKKYLNISEVDGCNC